MDLVAPIIEIVKLVSGPIVRYLKDQINFNDYLQNFKKLKEKLQPKQRDISLELHSQLIYGKKAKEEVKQWLDKVEEITGPVAQDIEDKIEKGGCLLRASGSLAKLLKEKIKEMEQLCEDGSKLPESLVVDDPSTSTTELQASELQGSGDVKAEILACLKGEKGEEVTKLAVWGMGGVGKTTIMMHVHNELLKEGNFNKIILVTVSQNFEVYKLQDQIASSLEENLDPRQNAINRAAMLSKMLEKHKPFLLILDDVWEGFELNKVGIPEPNVTNGCKLVLTTRSLEAVRSLDCKEIKVDTLPPEEALKLFLNKVGDAVLSDHEGGIKKDLESTLKEIVDECDGLPLALSTVAGSLKGISDSRLWSVALNQLRDCKRNVAGPDNADAFQILKFSYDRLEDKQIKDCFLYCALYPEDYMILKEEIIEYWIDEGFIDEMDTRQAMKDWGYYILKKLEECSLLELIKEEKLIEDEELMEGEVRGNHVSMHDLVRDMALDITRRSPRFLVEAGKALKELPERVNCAEGLEKVSLMHNYIEEIPSSMASSTCTRLTTLLLANNNLSTISESIFEHMPELKILDLSFNWQLRRLPNSVSKLVKLTTLLLEETSLEKVPSLSGLVSLKKLNLRGTRIKEVPEGLGMLKNLICLFLSGTKIVEIADGVLSNLSKLQELLVNKSEIKLKGDVVGRLKKLEVFHGRFPTVNEMRIFLKCQPNRLSDYFINVGRREDSFVTQNFENRLPRGAVRTVRYKEAGARYNEVWARYKEAGARYNEVGARCKEAGARYNEVGARCKEAGARYNEVGARCKEVGARYNEVGARCKEVGARYNEVGARCKEVGVRYNEAGVMCWGVAAGATNKGVEAEVVRYKKVVVFTETSIVGENMLFPSIQTLVVKGCHDIRSLNDFFKINDAEGLRECWIRGCDGMECIFPSWIDNPVVRTVEYLDLQNLHKLDGLFEANIIAKSSPPPGTFSSLKVVWIWGCKKLKKLFPSWKLVEYLQNLEEISVQYCEEMEEVIASDPEEGGEEGGDIIKELILPKLKELMLKHLPALKSICSRRAVMVSNSLEDIKITDCKGLRRIPFRLFPHLSLDGLDNLDWVFEVELIAMSPPQPRTFSFLKDVKIRKCKKLKKLFPSWKLVEYLQNLEEIDVGYCEEMEEIIASDPEEEGEGGDIIKELILPKLKYLSLCHLPALKSICSRRVVMVCDSLEYISISDYKVRIPFHLPPSLSLSGVDNLDSLFEVELIAMSPPQPRTFSFLKNVGIWECKKLKKLFPSWKLVEYLQNLEEMAVGYCEEMEEIIASDPEEEGEEGGDIIKKLILPKLKKLSLNKLPALKSICSRRAVMVCDSLGCILISDCKGLRRMPLSLPLVDNAQPSSPPPTLKAIIIKRGELVWWESLEWDHPNAKDVLQPLLDFFPDYSAFP
ncbi:hypothetical protein SLEP1_g57861 [Rubroshorea leprosula]|uniref:AAA+ ATPase domain-containing protein n=1 Tax=Rubroshorea leprosula TaxID=152421 RepID=A0AAV5MR32_9ROSI|nr:hypothetical protein SLEP1_g57861 [Rubroshorea leprosula]